MRVTDANLATLRTQWVAQSRANMAEKERQVASGKQFERASENPIDATRVLRADRRIARIDQFGRNAANAKLWVNTADQALQSANNNLERARTLAIQSGNPALNGEARAAIAADIHSMSESLRTAANTTVTGRAIFAGTADAAQAFDETGTYLGDDGIVRRTLDTHETVQVSLQGPEVFGASNPADPLNGTVFEMLETIADAVEADDQVTVRQGLDAINTASDRLGGALGRIGAISQQIDAADVRHGGEVLQVQANVSRIQDVDIAEAIIGMRSAELSHQATLQATSRALSQSLLDFLR